jgi:excisionase family DNA binding protein
VRVYRNPNGVGLAQNAEPELTIKHNAGLTGLAFYKVGEVAVILRVSECTVYRLISSRRLASVKIGGTILIRAEDLQRTINQQRTTTVWEEAQ